MSIEIGLSQAENGMRVLKAESVYSSGLMDWEVA
jgi:hypothetical protein